MLTSFFCVCKLWGLLKVHWRNVKTHQLVIVLNELKNMLISHTIFYRKLLLGFIFLAERVILNFVDDDRRSRVTA